MLPEGINILDFGRYLDQVWQNRPLLATTWDNEESKSTAQRFFQIEAGKIRAKNYTGFIQYGALRINVYPRVFHGKIPLDPLHTCRHLLKWLRYGRRIHFPFTELNTGAEYTNDLLEAFIFLFATFTSNSLTAAPHFAYEEITEEMRFIRGRLALAPYISQNLSTGRHHLLHCTYEPFTYDNLFNRIVKFTAKLLLRCTIQKRTAELLENIIFSLDEVTDCGYVASDCDKVKINRLYPEIDSIRNMCRLFLHSQQADAATIHNNNLCLLLPMETIFEEYVAGFLQHSFPDLSIRSQASEEYLAANEDGYPVFRMKHDILIPGRTIIDTKYKFRLAIDEKLGVSQNDMYQIVSYCFKRNIEDGMLLYPFQNNHEAVNRSSKFSVNSFQRTIIITCRSIDITEDDFDDFDENQKAKFKEILV
jgi:5-methylcytosine-specific restriction enzyme subunit McrC